MPVEDGHLACVCVGAMAPGRLQECDVVPCKLGGGPGAQTPF